MPTLLRPASRAARPWVVAAALMALAAVSFAAGTSKPASHSAKPASQSAKPKNPSPPPEKTGSNLGTAPSTGEFLPDSVILARVGDHIIRVRNFVEQYYSSYAEYRPTTDSAGRVQFLENLINKEIMGRVARKSGRAEDFEDRATMRDYTTRALANVLFQRAVYDSSPPATEAEIAKVHRQMGRELHLQQILFSDRQLAERVLKDLNARKLTWKDAVKRYSTIPADSMPDGDLGWRKRSDLVPTSAMVVFELPSGAYSPVLMEPWGHTIYRVAEQRTVTPPSLQVLHDVIGDEIRATRIGERSERLLSQMRIRVGMVHDTANLVWAASRFSRPYRMVNEGRPVLEVDNSTPVFSAADTGRVLARYNGGRVTVADVSEAYSNMIPLSRPSLVTFEAVQHFVDVIALEPKLADLARERGLDRDSMAVAMIDNRHEELMVEHLYQDSIQAKVQVTSAERRKYYDTHLAQFMTYPKVKYAAFGVTGRAAADSLAARLRAGEKAENILRADSLRGVRRGSIQERTHDEEGTPYYKLLFEELKPKQVSVESAGKDQYNVIQLLTYDAGRQLSYEESINFADDALQAHKAEQILKEFLARHRKDVLVVARPELVMQIRLLPPS